MRQFLRTVFLAALGSLALAGTAQAKGGHYLLEGGTTSQQSQVKRALDASSFDWNVVPATITIRIGSYESEATAGKIWLNADLLDSGKFSWGVIQHEYAHQVDFFLLTPTLRTKLAPQLGGASWFYGGNATSAYAPVSAAHGSYTCERFASTLAWAYWQSGDNAMKPMSKNDESAAMAPAKFRSLMTQLLAQPR
jgi:hypothetical protein